MIGNFRIDKEDAYAKYGICVAKGGYKGIVKFPSVKNVPANDWAEEDGLEPDLFSPKLNAYEISLSFIAVNQMKFGAFIELLSNKAYHEFDFYELNRKYDLRLVSQPDMAIKPGLQTFSLKFSCDFPLQSPGDYIQSSSLMPDTGYELDGKNLADYGVAVLQGSLPGILKSPDVKQNLAINTSDQNGIIYDGEVVKFKAKDVKLNCLMRAETIYEFWRNYDALIFDLTKPDVRKLYVESTGYEYECYYKDCSVTEFIPEDKIWFQFALNMVFVSFRVEEDIDLLASEKGKWIITENNDSIINLNYGN